MLRALYIRDYAVIEELEVDFDSGLNILTGETGAGKSIIVGALKLILGERASTEIIRTGARKAIVEGHFDGAHGEKIAAILEQHDIEQQPMLILRREIRGRQSRAFINDTPATAQVLRTLAGRLIDLHGQHDHQSLLRTETHIELLDNFGGLGNLVATYRQHHQEMAELHRRRRDLVARERELQQQKEWIEFQVREIDRIAPQDEEEQALEAERRIHENAEHLVDVTNHLYQMLFASDTSVYDQLVVARNELHDLARIDPQFDALFDEIKSAEIVIQEVTNVLQDYNAHLEFNPERLEAIRERLGELDHLKRKYGGSLAAVLAHRAEIGHSYRLAADFEGAIARLDEEIETTRKALSDAALRLSSKRREVAQRTEDAIRAELATLGIENGRLEVHFETRPDPEGWIALQHANAEPILHAAFANGMDQVEFFITTNVGEAPKSLAKVASGGEVSRIMLALKTILAKSDRLPILVFDEIDTGISGAVAQRVGHSMKNLAQYHQIIAITHLPQIAALADAHYVVEKVVENERTKSRIRPLDDRERAIEVAALISGTEVTEAALNSARELMAARDG